MLWPGSRDELSHCWVVVSSEISQCSKPDILLKDKVLSKGRNVQDIFPLDNLFKFSYLKRASICIWNSLPAKPDALGTPVLCEETLSYVSSYVYYCIFADLLHASFWLALFVCLNLRHRINLSIKYPWYQCWKTHHTNSAPDLPGFHIQGCSSDKALSQVQETEWKRDLLAYQVQSL